VPSDILKTLSPFPFLTTFIICTTKIAFAAPDMSGKLLLPTISKELVYAFHGEQENR